jgi:hypothetical protein
MQVLTFFLKINTKEEETIIVTIKQITIEIIIIMVIRIIITTIITKTTIIQTTNIIIIEIIINITINRTMRKRIIITSSNQNKKRNAINVVKVGPQAMFAIQNQTISKNQETTDERIMHK